MIIRSSSAGRALMAQAPRLLISAMPSASAALDRIARSSKTSPQVRGRVGPAHDRSRDGDSGYVERFGGPPGALGEQRNGLVADLAMTFAAIVHEERDEIG